MRKLLILYLLLFSLPALAIELPEKVYLKSATRGFTHQFEVSILEGRLWYRPKPARGIDTPKWELLGETGLSGFPSSVTELSTDGDNLIAIGSNGFIYYMKWSTRKWTNKWGIPLSEKIRLPQNIRSWSISHRGPFAGGYHDIDGNFHPVSAGVTTLYILSEDGLTIRYADPWLPADFSHAICGPLRNRFRARSLDASASTIFVISDTGEMYTRLADYDTMGNNQFLAYSYERRERDIPNEKDVRTLPPEEWKKQPSIAKDQGQISSAITIFQTGKGNYSRELRVEGVNAQGAHGFFSKPINGGTWSFVQTDLPLQKPLLTPGNGNSDWGPNLDQTLTGYIWTKRLFSKHKYEAELINFNPFCSGGFLVIVLGSDKFEFPFLTTASSQTDHKMKGAVTLPEEIKVKSAHNKELEELIRNLFGEKSFVEIKLNIDENNYVQVQSHSPFSLFPNVKMEFSKYGK